MNRLLGWMAVGVALLSLTSACRAGTYAAFLSGPAESPPNASPGTGFAEIEFNLAAHSMHVHVNFSGLVPLTVTGAPSGTTASHVHAATAVPGTGTAIVATELPLFTGFPTGVRSGTYDHTFDTSLAATWNPAFITAHGGTVGGPTGAEASFVASLDAGTAYLNIHTNAFPGGEIRGFLHAVPEPTSLALLSAGALGMFVIRRRRNVV